MAETSEYVESADDRRSLSALGGLGCFVAVTAILIVACVGGAFVVLNHRENNSGKSLSDAQLEALRLSGTWRSADGVTISFRPVTALGVDGSYAGDFTFTVPGRVPDWIPAGDTPIPSAGGEWGIGAGAPLDAPSVFMLDFGIFPASGGFMSEGAPLELTAFGNTTTPTLQCETPTPQDSCVFSKRP